MLADTFGMRAERGRRCQLDAKEVWAHLQFLTTILQRVVDKLPETKLPVLVDYLSPGSWSQLLARPAGAIEPQLCWPNHYDPCVSGPCASPLRPFCESVQATKNTVDHAMHARVPSDSVANMANATCRDSRGIVSASMVCNALSKPLMSLKNGQSTFRVPPSLTLAALPRRVLTKLLL